LIHYVCNNFTPIFAPISQKIDLFSNESIHPIISASFEKIVLTLEEVINQSNKQGNKTQFIEINQKI